MIYRFILGMLTVGLVSCLEITESTSTGDPTVALDQDDSLMNAAIGQARATLPQFKHRLATDTSVSYPAVKVRFATPQGAEHIWLRDIVVDRDSVKGIIDNAPSNLNGIQLGDTVAAKQDDISDWTFQKNDSIYGAYTIRALAQRMDSAGRENLRHSLGHPFSQQ